MNDTPNIYKDSRLLGFLIGTVVTILAFVFLFVGRCIEVVFNPFPSTKHVPEIIFGLPAAIFLILASRSKNAAIKIGIFVTLIVLAGLYFAPASYVPFLSR